MSAKPSLPDPQHPGVQPAAVQHPGVQQATAQPSHGDGAVHRRVRRLRDGELREAIDAVAAEVPVALAYNGEPFAVMMATPQDIADFALGFSLSEGIVAAAGELAVEDIAASLEGISVSLRVPPARAAALDSRRRNLQGRSGCGVCGTESIEAVLRPPPRVGDGPRIAASALQRALHELRRSQPLNALTGATHAAGWADADGALRFVREDVGRHNALDKLIGAMALAGADPQRGLCVVTSRASYEMAMKAAQAGIAVLAAISAPTALAIALAETSGLTLIGFARDDGHAVYTHPQRLQEDGDDTVAARHGYDPMSPPA